MNNDALLSSCLRTSPYGPLRSMNSYIVRLVLPPIRAIFQVVSLSDMALRDTRTTRERKYLHGSTPSPLLLPYLLKRRLDQEYGQGTQSCEAEKIAKGVLASCMDFVFRITRRFAFTFIYSRFRYCKFSVEPHLYHGHTFFSCVYDSLSSNQQQWGLCQTRRIFPTLGITW